ncbi:MAG: hypothetical protein RSC92_02805, partial [Clostridia bacterium]
MEYIVLIPGGFKPLTIAHINMINSYISNISIKKIILFIGNSKRDNINRDNAIYIIKNIFKLDIEIYN